MKTLSIKGSLINGVTLIELLVTITVVTLLSIPLFHTLRTSNKMGISARERVTATNPLLRILMLFQNWILMMSFPLSLQRIVPLTGFFSVDSLHIPSSPQGFHRFVSFDELPPSGGSEKVLSHFCSY